MFRQIAVRVVFVLAASGLGSALADADPTLHQVYEAAQSGHLDQAQQMMTQVLRDHPDSAKAHYVAAELDAKQGNIPLAREELNTAERLEPSLSFAKPEAVQNLKAELSHQRLIQTAPSASPASPAFPWGFVLAIGLGIAVIWMMMRARRAQTVPMPASGGMPGTWTGPATTGGMGSGLMGNLASGLAVGAGVVAGEELVRHLLDGDRRPRQDELAADRFDNDTSQQSNLGGNDFGVSDADSWSDDTSVGGDVGGDDWS